MMLMGLHGFGDATDCNDKCNQAYLADNSANASDTWNTCLASCGAGGGTVGGSLLSSLSMGTASPSSWSTAAPSQQAQSGWAQALQALTAGVTTGAGTLIAGQTPHPATVAPPTPWYMTPLGILGIVLAIGGGVYFIAKK